MEEDRSELEQRLLEDFEWVDEEDVEDQEPHKLFETSQELLECANQISEYVLLYINAACFEESSCSIDVPVHLHPLLFSHFDPEIDDTKFEVYRVLQYVTQQILEDEFQYKLEEKIHAFLPKETEISKIELVDDILGSIDDAPSLQVILHLK